MTTVSEGSGGRWECAPPSLSSLWDLTVPVSLLTSTPTSDKFTACCPGIKSRLLTPALKATGKSAWLPLQHLSLWIGHTKDQLSELTSPIPASEPLHMLVTWSRRLFPPGKFPLTLQGSVRSHLLLEAFPDSPSPLYLPFQGVYILGHHCLTRGLSPSLSCELPEDRALPSPSAV